MTISMLEFAIAAFCGIKDPKINKEYKVECVTYIANCAIVEDGKTTEKLFEKCREEWLNRQSK